MDDTLQSRHQALPPSKRAAMRSTVQIQSVQNDPPAQGNPRCMEEQQVKQPLPPSTHARGREGQDPGHGISTSPERGNVEVVRGGQGSRACDRGRGWDARSDVPRGDGGGGEGPRDHALHACVATLVPTSLLRAPSSYQLPWTFTNSGPPTLPGHHEVMQQILSTLRHTTNPRAFVGGKGGCLRTHTTQHVR